MPLGYKWHINLVKETMPIGNRFGGSGRGVIGNLKDIAVVICRGKYWERKHWNNTCLSNPKNKGGLIEI